MKKDHAPKILQNTENVLKQYSEKGKIWLNFV